MTIIPDTKDWTWVLSAPCLECGYDAATIAPEDVSDRLEDYAVAWQEVLGQSTVRDRPAPDVWSPLEYGCHVRDACQIYDERLRLMLTEDGPSYPNWDQDETALAARYREQEPETVAAELHAAAATLAARFAGVTGTEWDRTGYRSDGAEFTVDTFSRYFLHDIVHHLHDVGAGNSRSTSWGA